MRLHKKGQHTMKKLNLFICFLAVIFVCAVAEITPARAEERPSAASGAQSGCGGYYFVWAVKQL